MSNSEQTTKAEQTAEKPKLTPEQREAQRKQALDEAAKKAVSSATNLRAYLAVQTQLPPPRGTRFRRVGGSTEDCQEVQPIPTGDEQNPDAECGDRV